MSVPLEVQRCLEGWLAALNAEEPALYDPPWFAGRYRHTCPRRGGRSTALDLKERYVTLGEVLDGGKVPIPALPLHDIDDAAYAIIYNEGRCKWCGQTARTTQGHIVLVAERPPLTGRVAR